MQQAGMFIGWAIITVAKGGLLALGAMLVLRPLGVL